MGRKTTAWTFQKTKEWQMKQQRENESLNQLQKIQNIYIKCVFVKIDKNRKITNTDTAKKK